MAAAAKEADTRANWCVENHRRLPEKQAAWNNRDQIYYLQLWLKRYGAAAASAGCVCDHHIIISVPCRRVVATRSNDLATLSGLASRHENDENGPTTSLEPVGGGAMAGLLMYTEERTPLTLSDLDELARRKLHRWPTPADAMRAGSLEIRAEQLSFDYWGWLTLRRGIQEGRRPRVVDGAPMTLERSDEVARAALRGAPRPVPAREYRRKGDPSESR